MTSITSAILIINAWSAAARKAAAMKRKGKGKSKSLDSVKQKNMAESLKYLQKKQEGLSSTSPYKKEVAKDVARFSKK